MSDDYFTRSEYYDDGVRFGTGPEMITDIKRLRSELSSARERVAELEAALKPYSDFGVNVDGNGWTSNIHREPISTWFGPSDFRTARAKLEGKQDA